MSSEQHSAGYPGLAGRLPDKTKLLGCRGEKRSFSDTTGHLPDKAKLSELTVEQYLSDTTGHLPGKAKLSKLREYVRLNRLEEESLHHSVGTRLRKTEPLQVHYHIYQPIGNLAHHVAGSQIINPIQDREPI
ncbi:MAG: hypothetical protein AAFW84_13435 [Cyanobacteria bacterium J06635_15]